MSMRERPPRPLSCLKRNGHGEKQRGSVFFLCVVCVLKQNQITEGKIRWDRCWDFRSLVKVVRDVSLCTRIWLISSLLVLEKPSILLASAASASGFATWEPIAFETDAVILQESLSILETDRCVLDWFDSSWWRRSEVVMLTFCSGMWSVEPKPRSILVRYLNAKTGTWLVPALYAMICWYLLYFSTSDLFSALIFCCVVCGSTQPALKVWNCW